jgi:hypothetical protein
MFFVVILKVNDEISRIRIHTKMSWIRNTANQDYLNFFFPWTPVSLYPLLFLPQGTMLRNCDWS